MRQYEGGSAASDVTSEETEGEAHGWLIARSAPHDHCLLAKAATVLLQCPCLLTQAWMMWFVVQGGHQHMPYFRKQEVQTWRGRVWCGVQGPHERRR